MKTKNYFYALLDCRPFLGKRKLVASFFERLIRNSFGLEKFLILGNFYHKCVFLLLFCTFAEIFSHFNSKLW